MPVREFGRVEVYVATNNAIEITPADDDSRTISRL
jgi:hypothetical protein